MKKMRKIRLFQKDSYIGIDFLNKGKIGYTTIMKFYSNVFAFDIETPTGTKTIAMANPIVPEVNAIKKELEEFRDAILNNTKTVVSEMDGLMAMDVAHQILEKIGNNVITHS